MKGSYHLRHCLVNDVSSHMQVVDGTILTDKLAAMEAVLFLVLESGVEIT